MKKEFIKFAPMAKSYLPRFESRRFPQGRTMSVSYKSEGGEGGEDPEIKTSADLLKSLNEMKTSLETSLNEKAGKNIDEKLVAVNQLITDLKTAMEAKDAAEKLNAETIKEMQDDLKATIKGFDLLQTRVKAQGAGKIEAEVKTLSERIKEAVEEKHDDIVKFSKGQIKKLELGIKAVADVSTANVTGGSVWGAQYRPGIIMNQNTITQMRELIPVSNAGPGTDYYFMKENGVGEGNITTVAEKKAAAATDQATGLKSQFDLDLVESSVKFEIIAGFMLMSRKAFLNIPNFVSFLQKRIPQKLMDVESAQILYGDGASPNIKGLLTAGNFVASAATAPTLVERIIDDLALLEDTYKRYATGIALRPVDYFSFFKNKAAGSGEYDLPQGITFVNGILYILGVPVAKTTTLTAGDYIVGDFASGTELLVQEGMTLQFFEQDGTNVRTNQITGRIEETVALPVYGSDYFIKGSSVIV